MVILSRISPLHPSPFSTTKVISFGMEAFLVGVIGEASLIGSADTSAGVTDTSVATGGSVGSADTSACGSSADADALADGIFTVAGTSTVM